MQCALHSSAIIRVKGTDTLNHTSKLSVIRFLVIYILKNPSLRASFYNYAAESVLGCFSASKGSKSRDSSIRAMGAVGSARDPFMAGNGDACFTRRDWGRCR